VDVDVAEIEDLHGASVPRSLRRGGPIGKGPASTLPPLDRGPGFG
jgi:hypothetical protein